MEKTSTNVLSNTTIDREKLKEERRIRNKQKRQANQLEKQKEKSKLEALLTVKPQGSNVNLITSHFVNFAATSHQQQPAATKKEIVLGDSDFPPIGETSKTHLFNKHKFNSNINETIAKPKNDIKRNTNAKSAININLLDLISNNEKVQRSKPKAETSCVLYSGNPLDASRPQRKKGKHKQGRTTTRQSKLKKSIREDRGNDEDVQSSFKYFSQEMNPELDDAIQTFLSKIVAFQEKLYKRNPLKGQIKRRYVSGFHETKKHLKLGKLKMLIVATNVKVLKENDALHSVIKEIVETATKEEVPHYFALTRRKLGNITLKHMPISCVGILNYEGAEDDFQLVLDRAQKENREITMEPLSSLINNVISTLKDS